MKIVIDIPEEFENHFNSDRFEDSLARVASDIESFGFVLAGRYEQETITMLRKALKNAIPLPKGHGDLIDRSKIYKAIPAEEDNCTGVGMTLDEMDAYNDGIDAMYSLVHGAPTIIEADKAESEE